MLIGLVDIDVGFVVTTHSCGGSTRVVILDFIYTTVAVIIIAVEALMGP